MCLSCDVAEPDCSRSVASPPDVEGPSPPEYALRDAWLALDGLAGFGYRFLAGFFASCVV